MTTTFLKNKTQTVIPYPTMREITIVYDNVIVDVIPHPIGN